MSTAFPHRYTATLSRIGPSTARIDASPRPALTGGPPPEFGGAAEPWSPEHLLVSSLGLCLYTTFEALARREQLALGGWRATVEGVLDKTAHGLAFTGFRMEVDLQVAAADVERARVVLERARSQCIVTNALRAPVEVIARVAAAAA